MSTQEPTPRHSLSQIAKNPMAYMLFLAFSLVGYFARSLGDKEGARADDCNAKYDQCQTDLRTERERRDILTEKLLIQKGTIDAVSAIADSVGQKQQP